MWELPKREEQLKAIEEKIAKERERLYNSQKATEQLRQLENDLKTTQQYFKYVERRAKAIAEAAEEET